MKHSPTLRPAPWRARAIALAACVTYLAACEACEGDVARPNTADTTAARPVVHRPLASPEQLLAIGGALDDAANRLAPALDDRVGAAILRIHLDELAARLAAGDEPGARRLLASARQALDAAGGVGDGETVPGSAIRLVLDHVEALLNARDVTQGSEPAGLDSTGGAPAIRQ